MNLKKIFWGKAAVSEYYEDEAGLHIVSTRLVGSVDHLVSLFTGSGLVSDTTGDTAQGSGVLTPAMLEATSSTAKAAAPPSIPDLGKVVTPKAAMCESSTVSPASLVGPAMTPVASAEVVDLDAIKSPEALVGPAVSVSASANSAATEEIPIRDSAVANTANTPELPKMETRVVEVSPPSSLLPQPASVPDPVVVSPPVQLASVIPQAPDPLSVELVSGLDLSQYGTKPSVAAISQEVASVDALGIPSGHALSKSKISRVLSKVVFSEGDLTQQELAYLDTVGRACLNDPMDSVQRTLSSFMQVPPEAVADLTREQILQITSRVIPRFLVYKRQAAAKKA